MWGNFTESERAVWHEQAKDIDDSLQTNDGGEWNYSPLHAVVVAIPAAVVSHNLLGSLVGAGAGGPGTPRFEVRMLGARIIICGHPVSTSYWPASVVTRCHYETRRRTIFMFWRTKRQNGDISALYRLVQWPLFALLLRPLNHEHRPFITLLLTLILCRPALEGRTILSF